NLYKKPSSKRLSLALGILLGWSCLIRPVGLGLVIAVLAGLFIEGFWETGIGVGGIALAMWGAAVVRNIWLTHTPTAYWDQCSSPLSLSQQAAQMIVSLGDILRKLFGESLLGLSDLSGYAAMAWISTAAIFIGLVTVVGGFRHFCQRKKIAKGL